MRGSQFFCTGCGFRLQAGKRFCTNCGKPVQVVVPEQPSTPAGGQAPKKLMGGRWEIVRQLGKGGMGAVYLVRDTRLANRRAALKEMLDQSQTITDREESIARFNREAETLASLNHANIPHVYDRFTEEDRVYMVMEFIEGLDLEKLLEKYQGEMGRPLPERVVARYAFQLCTVLEYMHQNDPPTLHRDLKPSNVILQPSGVLKLIDFGIAKVFNPGSHGTGLGTQGYAAPEQYRGLTEPRSELYALGAMMHHLLTGRNPQLETPFDFPPLTSPETGRLGNLVMALLEMKPENRPGSAREVRRRLAELFPGVQEWEEDRAISGILRDKPRNVTLNLSAPASVPSSPPVVSHITQAPPAAAAEAPRPTPKFCTKCGSGLKPEQRFCIGCGNPVQVAAPPPAQVAPTPAPPPPPPRPQLVVPAALAGAQPLELLAFDDTAEPFGLLGVVQVNQTHYAFVSPGQTVQAGKPVEVYVQQWQGGEAVFSLPNLDSATVVQEIQAAWQSLLKPEQDQVAFAHDPWRAHHHDFLDRSQAAESSSDSNDSSDSSNDYDYDYDPD